jgi:hypothetical protein
MTIKLGYPVSINESSFRFAGIHCINNMFLIVLCKRRICNESFEKHIWWREVA